MRDSIDRYQVQTAPPLTPAKRLGSYLIEAGLLTTAQVEVALNDQKSTGMRFGEILAARGWVKQQTVEYLMKKVVLPERQVRKQSAPHPSAQSSTAHPATPPPQSSHPNTPVSQPQQQQAFTRREVPITKPLPPIKSSDNDVSWVG